MIKHYFLTLNFMRAEKTLSVESLRFDHTLSRTKGRLRTKFNSPRREMMP